MSHRGGLSLILERYAFWLIAGEIPARLRRAGISDVALYRVFKDAMEGDGWHDTLTVSIWFVLANTCFY